MEMDYTILETNIKNAKALQKQRRNLSNAFICSGMSHNQHLVKSFSNRLITKPLTTLQKSDFTTFQFFALSSTVLNH